MFEIAEAKVDAGEELSKIYSKDEITSLVLNDSLGIEQEVTIKLNRL